MIKNFVGCVFDYVQNFDKNFLCPKTINFVNRNGFFWQNKHFLPGYMCQFCQLSEDEEIEKIEYVYLWDLSACLLSFDQIG